MINKKFFLKLVAVTTLIFSALPIISFAAGTQDKIGVYVKGFWNGSYVLDNKDANTYVSFVSIQNNNSTDGDLLTALYNPRYNLKSGLLGGGAAIGYSINNNLKVEIEGIFSSYFTPINTGELSAVTRNQFLTRQQLDDSTVDAHFIYNANAAPSSSPKGVSILSNGGFNYQIGMLNVYYNASASDGIIAGYASVGAGMGNVNIKYTSVPIDVNGYLLKVADKTASSLNFVLQGKLGMNFNIENVPIKPYFGCRVLYILPKEQTIETIQTVAIISNVGLYGVITSSETFKATIKPQYWVKSLEVGFAYEF